MAAIMFGWGIFYFFLGERVPAGQGLGWDGATYADLVRNFSTLVQEHRLNTYYAQRIVPPLMVRAILEFTHSSLTNPAIVTAFAIYNLALLTLCPLIWACIAKKQDFSEINSWLGFAALFVNFSVSKQAHFYPVLGDVTALFIGLLLLLFYLEGRVTGIILTSIFGSFSWPVISLSGALLLLFPYRKGTSCDKYLNTGNIKRIYATDKFQLTLALFGLILTAGLYLLLKQGVIVSSKACTGIVNPLIELLTRLPDWGDTLSSALASKSSKCYIANLQDISASKLSAFPSLILVVVGLLHLKGPNSIFAGLTSQLRFSHKHTVIGAVIAFVLPVALIRAIANTELTNPSSLHFLVNLALEPQEGKLLLPLVSIAVFWGPAVITIILRWRTFCEHIRNCGFGAMAVVAMSTLLGLVGEPRFLTAGWPFFVLGFVSVIEDVKPSRRFYITFTILTILLAQFWLPLQSTTWSGGDNIHLNEFPRQLYFMHYGLWMNWPAYIIQSLFLTLSGFLIYRALRTYQTPMKG